MSKLAKKIPDHLWHMQTALKEAQKAYKNDEVPIGAVLVGPNGEVLSVQHNQKDFVLLVFLLDVTQEFYGLSLRDLIDLR